MNVGAHDRLVAQYPMHVLNLDFQSDVTTDGCHVWFFNVIDECTRKALTIIVRRSFTAPNDVAVLEGIIAQTRIHPTFFGVIVVQSSLPKP